MNRKEQDNYINVNLSRYTVKGIKDNPKVGGGVIGNGFDNLFSDYLNGLATKSPTHQNVLSDLNRYITGMGLVSTNPADQAILDKFFSKRKLRKIVDSKLVQATLTLEVIRGKFEDEIKAVICHNPAQFRVNRLADGTPDGFLYRKSWDRGDRYNYKISAEFDRIELKDKTQKSGLFYWYDNGSFPVYYGRPKYISGCDAIELEISAYTGVNHGVQNGMEASKIIELESSGDPDADAKAIQDITNDLSGVANRGKVAVRMRPAGAEPMTITESGSSRLADTYNAIFELAESGILKCHGIPSSSLISGLTSKSTAFADPAVEMEWAKEELKFKVIEDEREEILEILEPIFEDLGIQGEVDFKDRAEAPKVNVEPTQMSKEETTVLDSLLSSLGETYEDLEADYSIVDIRDANAELEDELNKQLEGQLKAEKLASTGTARPNSKSEQDGNKGTVQFKVRYRYSGDATGEREFCRKMLSANKLYRKEDIEIMSRTPNVNAKFSPKGKSTYDIFLWKGGVYCHHKWERVTFVRRGLEGSIDVKNPNANTLSESQADQRGMNPNNNPLVQTRPIDTPTRGKLN